MEVTKTPINGLLVIQPSVFNDDRGYFFESYNKETLQGLGLDAHFVQDNQSFSKKNVLRGLHFQNPPYEQGKLVRVVQGGVLDVAVDIRNGSPTYGQYYKIKLTADNKKMFWIPPGFAHGFIALENDTVFVYKCTKGYNKESEGSLRWNCPDLNIDWGINDPILSEKDAVAPLLKDFESQF